MKIISLGWTMPSWIKINKRGGAAIRISWCKFFQTKLFGGGRLFLTGESNLWRAKIHAGIGEHLEVLATQHALLIYNHV